MKTSSSNKKIRELVNMVKDGALIPRPEFQRRLVWTREDKNYFLDSILRGYPFPEIYLADGDVDTETGEGTQLLVDGLQRISTISQYFNGDSDLSLTIVPPYKELPDADKVRFLQYDVSIRDLGAITKESIIEVFKRINATKYALSDIEVNNALYGGKLKKFADSLADHPFFKSNRVFQPSDYKRMNDLRYALLIVGTMLVGYFNRDDAFDELLSRYNDDFPQESEVYGRIDSVFSFIDECGFEPTSRLWRKADLFTTVIELDRCLNTKGERLQPGVALARVNWFFGMVDQGSLEQTKPPGIYYKAALQASNDRGNRLRRGVIMELVLTGHDEDYIVKELTDQALI